MEGYVDGYIDAVSDMLSSLNNTRGEIDSQERVIKLLADMNKNLDKLKNR